PSQMQKARLELLKKRLVHDLSVVLFPLESRAPTVDRQLASKVREAFSKQALRLLAPSSFRSGAGGPYQPMFSSVQPPSSKLAKIAASRTHGATSQARHNAWNPSMTKQ